MGNQPTEDAKFPVGWKCKNGEAEIKAVEKNGEVVIKECGNVPGFCALYWHLIEEMIDGRNPDEVEEQPDDCVLLKFYRGRLNYWRNVPWQQIIV